MLIFAIDDEKPLLRAAKRILGEAVPGAEILTFSDASCALSAAADPDSAPDLVFSDIEMPGMTGLELALRLKTAAPDARVIFVTGFSQYAIDAFKVHAQGYIMKPLTVEAVREELSAIPSLTLPSADRLQIRCFGHFEVFWQGEPLLFQRRQTKELLAFLIDREGAACTAEEVMAALWEDETDARAAKQRIRNLINDLKSTLQSIGMEKVLIRSRQQLAVRRDLVDCDYYRMLDGDMDALNSFRGEYMVDYSWAELTAGKLYFL
ncbi:MAG: response regulator [Firmicutes bacterium]|nr:response regulator [Bacillota bacterium]